MIGRKPGERCAREIAVVFLSVGRPRALVLRDYGVTLSDRGLRLEVTTLEPSDYQETFAGSVEASMAVIDGPSSDRHMDWGLPRSFLHTGDETG